MRSPRHNDGRYPIVLSFVSRNLDRVTHAGIAALVEGSLRRSMAVFGVESSAFEALGSYCRVPDATLEAHEESGDAVDTSGSVPPMPREPLRGERSKRPRTVGEKIREPHLMERMLRAAGDLSAPAQIRFMQTVEALASQLREVLLATGGIVKLNKDHHEFWSSVRDKRIGFVDGGLANLAMLGSAPVAARVGGYTVVPGRRGSDREAFVVLKQLIDELYSGSDGGVFDDSFPDVGALRDAARISVEAGGAIKLIADFTDHEWVFTHGALVNPVSRYSDVMEDSRVRFRFPDFSDDALSILLPSSEPARKGRQRNFIAVHHRQLELLEASSPVVCGVIERESTTTMVCRSVLDGLSDEDIRDLLPVPPARWKQEFRFAIDPNQSDEFEGQRISDPLLFRCVLEPGEALAPVVVDRNELRRAPERWKDYVGRYPKPRASYLQVSEWNAPIRVEMFEKDLSAFQRTALLIYHCALLLPQYAFPVGLDIVDRFARIPNWMSRPVNTRTAVLALKSALDQGETGVFDALRRMLCGSGREFLLRPSVR